jgi:Cu(I)/Ag(I) efflux system membrane fusion protein/cobalt-zinc-cadmium efflux system membrane fusion protein
MTLRKTIMAALLLALGFAAGAGAFRWFGLEAPARVSEEAGSAADPDRSKTWYTCGMHPEVVEDHPGDCPKCDMKLQPMSDDRAAALGLVETTGDTASAPKKGRKVVYWKSSMIPGELHTEPGKDSMGMDLIPVYADEVAGAASIRIDPVTEQNMGVRVDTVVRGPLTKAVRTVGFVDYDETTLATINTKVDGWIEKLHVDQTGAQVHKGEALFELYSPELFSAQEEYLSALRNRQVGDVRSMPRARLDSDALVSDARTRLEYFDVSAPQIRELERTGKATKTLTIRAPFTGIVTDKKVVEGQRIMAGMEVFRIADVSTVWVIGKVYEHDLPYVKLGQEAFMTLSYVPGKTFRGRVTYVYPYLEPKTREVPVRMEFHNPGYELKPGMYTTVTLISALAPEATLVPDVAVINTGLRSVVFTMPEPGRFEAREVTIGVRAENNFLQVLSGLAPGETVVVSGQFLLDSESRLREAALKFVEPGKADGATPIKAATERAEELRGAQPHAAGEKLYYACPMPQHVDILYDKPGKCPLCAMALVPVMRREGHVENPPIAYWTCPMPEHPRVHEKGPGKCPICGMSLVPVTEASPPGAENSSPEPAHDHDASKETNR